jgi:peptidoglycan/xylan/chitin deacetylase (PgdA/CDA1 family)
MVPVKGLDVLLHACSTLQSHGTSFKLYLIGNGPLRATLEAQCASLGITDHVRFIGSVPHDQLGSWYRAADCTVLSSHSEGIPNVLRESLACGTPFVATRVGGISEIASGPLNRLVDAGDHSALADAVKSILSTCEKLHLAAPAVDRTDERLLEIISPLVNASKNAVRPWWAGRQHANFDLPPKSARPKPTTILRCMLKQAVPKSLFLAKGPRSSNAVCLTFDDGPHPEHTPKILDHLSAFHIRAIFFVVGRLAEQYPEIVRRIVAEGHLIGNHCYYHTELPSLNAREALIATDRNRVVLENLANGSGFLYRPPRGQIRPMQMLRLWAGGYRFLMWSADPRDYAAATSEQLRKRLQEYPWQAGDIILLHDRVSYTVAALPALIESVRGRGLVFASGVEWIGAVPDVRHHENPLAGNRAAEIQQVLN